MKTSDEVLEVCRVERIGLMELEEMVRRSAPYTHEWANRRWMNWIFKADMSSLRVERMAYKEVPGYTGNSFMHIECDVCEGHGCKACGWHGEVKVRVS